MRSWVEFWDAEHTIYVNDRHKAAHARHVCTDIVRLLPGNRPRVLDFGCGEAIYAESLAPHCGTLVLCDAAEHVRERLRQRVTGIDHIDVVGAEQLMERYAGAKFDLVLVNSVTQYLNPQQLQALLADWRALLASDGRLIVADVVPPGLGKLSDAAALLKFAHSEGFLFGAVTGLVRTAVSNYGALRNQLGFSVHREGEFLAILDTHGFRARRIHPNIGHNQGRMAFEAIHRALPVERI